MPLSLTTFKTSNTSYWPRVSGKPALKLDISANPWDDLMDYLQANVGQLADPGGNGLVKRTALNVTAAAVAGTDYVVPVTTPSAWTAPTLLNGWSNTGGANNVAQYIIDAGGFVHIRGQITGGTTTDGTIIFTLPIGYRPPATVGMPCGAGTTTATFGLLSIDASGNVKIFSVTGNLNLNAHFSTQS